MRRFYAPISNFADQIVSLSEDETRHLRDVLRLKTGDEASVFDGSGREFRCSISTIGKKISELAIVEEIQPTSPESPLELAIAPTVLNGEKYDLIVQKAVELGVSSLIPLITVRCDVKPKDAAKRLERWRRIALEATKQCGRAKLMEIREPIVFADFVEDPVATNVIMFSEREGSDFSVVRAASQTTALFGPKGGWDDAELELARKRDINVVTLGGRILRAETAAIALTAILQHRFGDVN